MAGQQEASVCNERAASVAYVKGVAQSMQALATVLDVHLSKPTDIESILPSALRETADSLKETIEMLQSQVDEAAKDAAAENLLHASELNHDDGDERNCNDDNANDETARVAADDAEEGDNSSPFMRPEDEPQSHEVFLRASSRRRATSKYLFNPNWTGKMAWDFFVMFLVLADSIILPFQLAFKHGMERSEFDTTWFWITLVFFGTDIFCTFNSAIEIDEDGTPDSILRDRYLIAKNYVRGWFVLDFVSTVPWGDLAALFSGGEGGGSSGAAKLMKIMKFLRIMRLMRMLRMAKLRAIWEQVETYMASIVFTQSMALIKVFCTVLALCHWFACLFWMVGSPDSLITSILPESVSEPFAALDHWTTVSRVSFANQAPWSYAQKDIMEQYVFSFYWTLGVMRTMPAEVQPVNLVERIFVLIFMMFALSAFAIMVGSLTQAFFKMAERSRGFNDEMFAVRMHLKRIGLERHAARQVKQYMAHLFERRRVNAKEAMLLSKLPHVLQTELTNAATVKQLQMLPEVRGMNPEILKEIANSCELYDRLAGDIICVANHPAHACWIMVVGRCQCEYIDGEKHMIRAPCIIDEETLQVPEEYKSPCTVTAITCCEMLRVDKEVFVKYVVLKAELEQPDKTRRVSSAVGIRTVSSGTTHHTNHNDTAAAAVASLA
eukprot:TRINITY_DN9665_c0_g2_i1.p1 TRINITY_DN9665_c0_g2~~TRINITY_DN9665_c0_g2_i1.p1  ORF type:complete len:666 (-),score=125.89 TRINITY_DN9665_c0_g2_i1:134-2131(-)